MSSGINPVAEIYWNDTYHRRCSTILVKVIKKRGIRQFWTEDGKLFDVHLEDVQGDQIRLTAFNEFAITQNYQKFQIGRWYYVTGFCVYVPLKYWSSIDHQFEIKIVDNTQIVPYSSN